MTENNVTAFIIAGGKSKRFGQDKSLYKYMGLTLIEHVINAVQPVIGNIVIIANDSKKLNFINYQIIPDIVPGLGPIGGIYTALEKSKTQRVFCFACDLPYLNSDVINYMSSISSDSDIVVPKIKGYFEALHAIYSKNCLKTIENNILKNNLKIINIYDELNVKEIDEDKISQFANIKKIFKNINSLNDLCQE